MVLLEVAVEIAHEPSFGASVEVAGEILVDNAIPGLPNDSPDIHVSILEVLFHTRSGNRAKRTRPGFRQRPGTRPILPQRSNPDDQTVL